MNLLNQEISLSFNSVVFYILAFTIVILFALVGYLFVKMRRSQKVTQQKYGFLGKTLYATLITTLLAGGLVIGIISTTGDRGVFEVNANKTLSADIMTAPLMKENGYTFVDFKVVPTVEGAIWGKEGSLYTIYWSFEGTDGQSFTFLEQNVSSKSLSGLQKYFKDGKYKIKVVVVFEDSSYTFTKEVTF